MNLRKENIRCNVYEENGIEYVNGKWFLKEVNRRLVDVGIVFMWMKVLRVVFGFMFQGIKMDKLVRWM